MTKTKMVSKQEAVQVINEAVNTALSDKIRDLLGSGKYKVLEVQATLCFVLACAIADSSMDNGVTEERMCAVANAFEAYIHSACHAMYEGFESGDLPRVSSKKHH